MVDKKIIISIALPIVSILIIIGFIASTNQITGLVILDNTTSQHLIDADITLKTYPDELLPENAHIQISIGNTTASLTIKEFIEKTGTPYNQSYGALPVINYVGRGFTGNHTYKLNLSQLNIDRNIGTGSHTLKTSIVYNGELLFESKREINIR